MPSIQSVFGAEVRRRRLAAGLTQEALAERAGRHWTYIGAIERGTRNVTLAVIGDLAEALDVEPADLFPRVRRAKK